uniref:Uncharacterized protein n=1 Tax=Stegastes partitus TaxID=144197 RepID=A0A3B4ZL97_9TELE
MAEPAGKRLKSSLPLCRYLQPAAGHNPPAAVEEALCGVSSLLWDGAYRLQALVGNTTTQHAECKHEAGKPSCEVVYAVLPVLYSVFDHENLHTGHVVKSHFLVPRVDHPPTSVHRVGCTSDQKAGFREYILTELQ